MRTGLLVLGGGSWGFPSFSTDDQARFSSLEKQKISRLILAMRVCLTVRRILLRITRTKRRDHGRSRN
jgi:hypothetical protein